MFKNLLREDLVSFAPRSGHEQAISTNICDSYQVRHILKLASCEIGITRRLDFLQSPVDLRPEFFLACHGAWPTPKIRESAGEFARIAFEETITEDESPTVFAVVSCPASMIVLRIVSWMTSG